MGIKNEKFLISTEGSNDIVDITQKVNDIVKKTNIKNALIHIYTPASTASISTIEYEPGIVKDLPEVLDKIASADKTYHHDSTWGDSNGYAHIRAALMGSSVTIPLANDEIELGQWQQIVLIDFDNKPRTRSIIIQVLY